MKLAPIFLISVLALAACSPKKEGPPPAAAAVDVVAVKSALLSTKVSLPAQLTPFESVDLYPKVAGFIQEIRVDRGSRVRQGDLLVRLTAPEVAAQQGQSEATVSAAQAQLVSAQAKLAADRATFDRLASAARTPGAVAENDLNIARQVAASDAALVDAATANVAATRAGARNTAQTGAYLEIRAPFDGVITARNLHPGALVGPATGQSGAVPILQMVSANRLRLVVAVPENSIQQAHTGQMITFTVPTAPGQSFQAPIARMAQSVDARTRTMMVEADIANPANALTPGIFATVQWPIERAAPTLRVPPTAVANDQQRQFVIRVANGTAEWVDVTTGMSADGGLEVFGKLNAGELVVKRGTDAIHSGDKIKTALAK